MLAVLIVLAIGAAITLAIVAIVNAVRKKHEGKELSQSQWTTRELIFGALCIAIAFALSYLKFFEMPQGGSITPASMLPIVMFAYIYGTPKGVLVALAYGLLQLLQDAFVVHWAQLIMDYIFAFLPLALAGLFKRSMLPGVLIGGLGRLVFSTLLGRHLLLGVRGHAEPVDILVRLQRHLRRAGDRHLLRDRAHPRRAQSHRPVQSAGRGTEKGGCAGIRTYGILGIGARAGCNPRP